MGYKMLLSMLMKMLVDSEQMAVLLMLMMMETEVFVVFDVVPVVCDVVSEDG